MLTNLKSIYGETYMVKRVGAREARTRFSELIGGVRFGSEEVIVERSGKPMAAMIPIDMYERLIAERRVRFEVLERVRSRLPDISPEEIDRDVTEAVSRVREGSAACGS